MCRTHDGAARVGDGRHARFADQAHVMSGQCCCQQRFGVKYRRTFVAVVAFFMGFTWQLCNVLGLDGCSQRKEGVNALEVGAGRFGVFADPVGQRGGAAQRAFGQYFSQCRLAVTAKIERSWHQIKGSSFLFSSVAHGSTTPAARSNWQVRISGRPISAVGSSLTMASSKAMPRPSLLAEPAQS